MMRSHIFLLSSLLVLLHPGVSFTPLPTPQRHAATFSLLASPIDYNSLTVPELKQLVKEQPDLERGLLSTFKRKQDLIEYLLESSREGEEQDDSMDDDTQEEPLSIDIGNDNDTEDDTIHKEEDDGPVYFSDLSLSPEALTAIEAQDRWYLPTPIQQLAIPKLIQETSGSFWCEAPTGSGKTAAFVLPLLQRLKNEQQRKSNSKVRSLILCPTRELAVQIGQVVEDLASYMMDCNTLVVTGGFRRDDQIAQLAEWNSMDDDQGVDVLIATPGRLVDVLTRYNPNGADNAAEAALERRLLQAMDDTESDSLSLEQIQAMKLDRTDDQGRASLSNLLENVQYLVLDEADRLLGRAFETEVNAVLDLLKPEQQNKQQQQPLQTWLFSATFPKLIEPRVESVLKRLGQTSTTRISCANSDRIVNSDEELSATLQKKLEHATNIKQLAPQVGPASTIQTRTIRMDKRDRTQALKNLVAAHEKEWTQQGGAGVLVFVATRYAAEHVSRKLRRVGIRSSELHGKLDQEARARRLRDLQSGKTQVLLATDLASRGLDVVGLSAVVNYDLPRSTADFVHRVGRTGRAGRRGTAITFVTPQTESHYDLIEKRHIPQDAVSEREMLPGLEVDEEQWMIQSQGARIRTPGAGPSANDLAHDRMHGGLKGRRKSKKDRLREKAAAKAAAAAAQAAAGSS